MQNFVYFIIIIIFVCPPQYINSKYNVRQGAAQDTPEQLLISIRTFLCF